MKILKKLAAAFVCVTMAAGALPALAAGSAEQTFEIQSDASSLPDNDALFASYVNQIFYGRNDYTLFGNYGETIFTGTDLQAYNELKAQVQRVASGESESTVLEISDMNWTYEELGLTSSASDADVVAAIQAKLNLLIDALFYDCPYEFYWCNKKSTQVGYQNLTRDQTQVHFIGPHFRYCVAEAYQNGSDTTVNPEKVTAAKTAAENALKIVADNAGKTDREKLAAYREVICSLVSYDYDSAYGSISGTVPYGDPWQMIYVFDGDDSTNVVCEGYSKAFQYLCDMSEFDSVTCYVVTGTLDGGDHMWNLVTIDGVNYFCDVTNTDVLGLDLFFDASEVVSTSDEGCTIIIVGSSTAEYLYSGETRSLYTANILTLGTSVKGVSLNQSELTLKEGETAELEAVLTPENATNKAVTWQSSNESVATVSNGVVTALSAGETVITASTCDGGYSAQCALTVIAVIPVTSVTLDQTELTLSIGEFAELQASVLPADATDKTVAWQSSDESVAAVENGTVTAISAGTAVITATSGEKSASCTVTVQAAEEEKRVIDYGTCGDDLTWVFDSDYVLTISGTGEMYDCISEDNVVATPWSGWLVKKIVIEEGVTSIGAGAFFGETSLTEVKLPSTLTAIGKYAFQKCYALETLVIPDTVTQIDQGAFSYCTALKEVYLSSGMPQAGYACFYECTNLTTVHVPVEVTSLGIGAFYNTAVTEIYYGGTEEQWSNVDILNSSIALDAAVYFTNPNINSVSIERTDGAVVVTIDFDNPTGGSVLAVGYGQNGEMVDIKSVSGTEIELSPDTQSVKVFLWDSLSGMVPLCEAAEQAVN